VHYFAFVLVSVADDAGALPGTDVVSRVFHLE
jgi:hypothetical protein